MKSDELDNPCDQDFNSETKHCHCDLFEWDGTPWTYEFLVEHGCHCPELVIAHERYLWKDRRL